MSAGGEAETGPAASFLAARPRLLGLAYRMLGSVADAEDILQDAYERWHRAIEAGPIESPDAFLTTVVTRLCIDRYKRERSRREQYPGPWLPEPLVTGEDPTRRSAETDETLSMGMLRLLESLPPLERAVFVLAEAFDYRAREIADVVGRNEAHCRQLLSRARRRLAAGRPQRRASPAERRRLVDAFLHAARDGDAESLVGSLAPDVVMYSDGGGKAAAASKPVVGRRAVSRFLLGVRRLAGGRRIHLRLAELNGEAALLVFADGVLETAFVVETGPGGITAIHAMRNPDKLARLGV